MLSLQQLKVENLVLVIVACSEEFLVLYVRFQVPTVAAVEAILVCWILQSYRYLYYFLRTGCQAIQVIVLAALVIFERVLALLDEGVVDLEISTLEQELSWLVFCVRLLWRHLVLDVADNEHLVIVYLGSSAVVFDLNEQSGPALCVEWLILVFA